MNSKSVINELRVEAYAKCIKRKYIKSGCVLLSLQWCSQITCVLGLYINTRKDNSDDEGWRSRPWRLAINLRMLKILVMDFLVLKPQFSRRLSRIFFSTSSRLSRNFRGRLAGLAQIAAGGRLSRRLRGLPVHDSNDPPATLPATPLPKIWVSRPSAPRIDAPV